MSNQILRCTFALVVLVGCSSRSDLSQRSGDGPSGSAGQDIAAIVSILADQLGIKPEQVAPDATLRSLGADELDVVEIIMMVEEQFHVEITDEQIVHQIGEGGAEDMLTARGLAALVTASKSIDRRVNGQ